MVGVVEDLVLDVFLALVGRRRVCLLVQVGEGAMMDTQFRGHVHVFWRTLLMLQVKRRWIMCIGRCMGCDIFHIFQVMLYVPWPTFSMQI
jgi:hypothetical protein